MRNNLPTGTSTTYIIRNEEVWSRLPRRAAPWPQMGILTIEESYYRLLVLSSSLILRYGVTDQGGEKGILVFS